MAKIALLVGVSEYEPGLNALPAAVKDIEAMRDVLLHPEIGGFAESDITVLKNPNRQVMEEAIETLFTGKHKDDLVVLFFSGHGIKDDSGRLYLATNSTRKTVQGELIRSTAVPSNFVQDNMSRSRSRRQVVILDSCFSGAFAEGLSAKDDGAVDIRTQLGGEGRAVLTSSSSTQYSFEHEGSELSLYTRFLIEGIQTGAADLDEDEMVSIDELHEYASRKVREMKPEMRPEIYAMREGFKIRLTKVPPVDPMLKYRREVARFINRGDISLIGRRTLEVLRTRLQLEENEAKAIEDEVLEPYRIEFRQKREQYEQVFTEAIQQNESLSEFDRAELQKLQQILGLRNEDTMPIEATVIAHLKAHKKKLAEYEQIFTETLRQEYPLSEAKRTELLKIQKQLDLTDIDVTPIKSRITTEIKTYHQHLNQYKQIFIGTTQQEYPLSDIKRSELRQQQKSLGLTDIDVASIEAEITTKIETYQQKLQQYEQTFVNTTQRKHHPDETTRQQLQQTWQTLELNETDIVLIESRIISQIELYQKNLQQYEQDFVDTTQQQYPLSELQQNELQKRRNTLNLADEDVSHIEDRISTEINEYLNKLKQYEQVLVESADYEYPFDEVTCEELRRFQQTLELKDEDIALIEDKVSRQRQEETIIPEFSKNTPPQIENRYRIENPYCVDEISTQKEDSLQETIKTPELKSKNNKFKSLLIFLRKCFGLLLLSLGTILSLSVLTTLFFAVKDFSAFLLWAFSMAWCIFVSYVGWGIYKGEFRDGSFGLRRKY
jgi:Caspase domain